MSSTSNNRVGNGAAGQTEPKLQAVSDMQRPNTVEELRTFLGLTGYLRQFVENYSITAAPLTNILRNKNFASKRSRKMPISWEGEQEEAFKGLKKAVASAKGLAFPDWSKPFILHTDASEVGTGAVLAQKNESTPSRVTVFPKRTQDAVPPSENVWQYCGQ